MYLVVFTDAGNPDHRLRPAAVSLTARHDFALTRGSTMIKKQPSPNHSRIRVTFELPSCLWADRIFVVGDFNDWSRTATPMQQARDGAWQATLELEIGRDYEFRYLIDGAWHTDYHADASRINAFGSENSVVDLVAAPGELTEGGYDAALLAPMTQFAARLTLPSRKEMAAAA